jgi:hypothetical protein
LEARIDDVHKRVYDGLGMELRKEIQTAIGGTNKLIVSILISLLLLLVGVIVEGRWSAGQATRENDRNYAAIQVLNQKLDDHIGK